MCHLSVSPVSNHGKMTRSPQSDLTPWIRVLIQGQGVCFASIPAKIKVRVDSFPLSPLRPFPFQRLWLCTKAALIQLILGTLFLYAYKDKNVLSKQFYVLANFTSRTPCSRINRNANFISQDFFHFSSFILDGDNLNMLKRLRFHGEFLENFQICIKWKKILMFLLISMQYCGKLKNKGVKSMWILKDLRKLVQGFPK